MAATAPVVPSTLQSTATQGILAMKGSGKTYRAMAQAEEMLDRGAQIVCIDPTGAWWGLRYAADDTSRVLYQQLALLGGDKGSIDLLDSHGTVVAKAVVEKKMSCVLDLSRMSKAGMRRFVAAFLLELFRTNPNRQIHLFIDEADLFAPQHAQGEAATVAGAMSDVVRRGRKKGIGVTMISQRPQALSTDVRNQCEVMTLLRVKGTHDLDAIEDWLDSNGFEAKAIRNALPRLHPGDYFRCGGDDTEAPLIPREATRRKSYDSGRTPEEGDEAVGLVEAFDADLLREWLGEASEELEKNDPKALQQRVRDLESELAAKSEVRGQRSEEIRALQSVLDLTKDELAQTAEKRDYWKRIAIELTRDCQTPYIALMEKLEAVVKEYHASERKKWQPIADLMNDPAINMNHPANTPEPGGRNGTGKSTLRRLPTVGELAAPGAPMPDFVGETEAVTQSHEAQARSEELQELGRCEYAILSVLKRGPRDRESLAILSVYSATSGGFGAALANLRERGLIQDANGTISLSSQGNRLAPNDGWPFMRGGKLLEVWKKKLGKCEAEIMDTLITRGPARRDVVAKTTATGYSPTSGGFGAALANLRKLGLIHDEGVLLAAHKLFNFSA